jgi:hypothetical protein
LTAGMASRALSFWGLSWTVNTSSTAYAVGAIVGQVILLLVPGVAAMTAPLRVMGLVCTAAEAAEAGNWPVAVGALALALVTALGACSPVGQAISVTLALVNVGTALVNVYQQLMQPGVDASGAALQLIGAGANLFLVASSLSSSCFTGDTKVLTRRGWVRLDELSDLDEVASCDEQDALGPVVFKRVLAVFHLPAARIWHVHVQGKVIRTTAEHPFYVWGKGWVQAHHVEPGDRFRGDDGRMVTAEEVLDTGVQEGVYNCAVEDYHTYFVGGEDWGFSVWAHNSCFGTTAFGNKMHLKFKSFLKKLFPKTEFAFNVRPGQTGPDAVVTGGTYPGFSRAELKPFSLSGWRQFSVQEGNWGTTRLFAYNAQGKIFPWPST